MSVFLAIYEENPPVLHIQHCRCIMHDFVIHIIVPLWGESIGHQWIPLTKGQ